VNIELTYRFVFKQGRIHNGGVLLTPSSSLSLASSVPDLQVIEQHLSCEECPIFQQDAPWAEKFISPQLGQRTSDGQSQEIICPGIDKPGVKKAGGKLENLPCYRNTTNPMTRTISI